MVFEWDFGVKTVFSKRKIIIFAGDFLAD